MDRHASLVLHMTHDPMQELFQSSETRVSHELYLASIAFSILKELEGLGMDDSLLPLGQMQLRVVLKPGKWRICPTTHWNWYCWGRVAIAWNFDVPGSVGFASETRFIKGAAGQPEVAGLLLTAGVIRESIRRSRGSQIGSERITLGHIES